MSKILIFSILFSFFSISCSSIKNYPSHWWQNPENLGNVPDWEILPESGERGKSVILSKRHELGILSNFAATPFLFDGKRFASLEGFWQAMKFPENKSDVRYKKEGVKWPISRSDVEQMVAFEAKKAGDVGSENMKKLGIDWVSYKGRQFIYRTQEKGEHYQLIRKAMIEKLNQNPKVKEILLSTGNLILLPDHHTPENSPPAWRYNQIWMEIRDEIIKK